MSRNWEAWDQEIEEDLEDYYAGKTDPPPGHPDALAEAALEEESHARFGPPESTFTVPPCPDRVPDETPAPHRTGSDEYDPFTEYPSFASEMGA
jgi:hypothetical protein